MNWETNEVLLFINNNEGLYTDIIINKIDVQQTIEQLGDILFSHVDLEKVDYNQLEDEIDELRYEY